MKTLSPLAPALSGAERSFLTTVVTPTIEEKVERKQMKTLLAGPSPIALWTRPGHELEIEIDDQTPT